MQPYFHRGITAPSAHFQCTLTHTFTILHTRSLCYFSTRRNKSLNLDTKATFLSLVKTARSTAMYFSVSSMFISLPLGMSLALLLGLLSAVLIAVAFRHLATKTLFYFACFYFYFAVFSRHGHCRLTTIVFATWIAVLFVASLRHF